MRKKRWFKRIFGILFLLSLVMMIYSITSVLMAEKKQEQAMIEVESKLTKIEKQPPIKKEKNTTKDVNNLSKLAQETPYEYRPTKGEAFGKIIIPSIKLEAPIIEGTEEKQLTKGVGHYLGSVLPGEWDNSVLAAHRDTIFKHLGDVQIGDKIEIETIAGKFTYEVTKQRIVEADDRTVIVPTQNPIITLVTCYPFDYIGPAPKRYILQGKLIGEESKTDIRKNAFD